MELEEEGEEEGCAGRQCPNSLLCAPAQNGPGQGDSSELPSAEEVETTRLWKIEGLCKLSWEEGTWGKGVLVGSA